MSKGVRWTIYIIVTVGIMGLGFYITHTERPDSYTPRESPYGASEPGTSQSGDAPTVDGAEQGWQARIVGRVAGTQPMKSNDQELFSIVLEYEDDIEIDGPMNPQIESPINLVASQEVFESKLDRLPKLGDLLLIKTQSSEKAPIILPIQHVEFAEDDG